MSEHIVSAFDTELGALRRSVAEMGGIAEKMLGDATQALVRRDQSLAQSVIVADPRLDGLQRDIEEQAILTIAKRQPMAVDLREVISAIRISGDVERVGDLAKNIAKRAVAVSGQFQPQKIAFGVSPAIILYLWSLQAWPRFGWLFAIAYAACMALRLARFNARIDALDQPHKSAGFLTGVPAPVGAGLLLLPMFLWIASGREWAWLNDYRLVAPWAAFVAFLLISSIATFSWGSLRLRRHVRLEAIAGEFPDEGE